MRGNNVLMVSGTDEHGTPLLVQADKEGVSVRELADRYNRQIVEDLRGLGLSYDWFTRTVTRTHYATVQELFKGLYNNGYMVKETTMGRFRRRRDVLCRTAILKEPVRFATPMVLAAISVITAVTNSIPLI